MDKTEIAKLKNTYRGMLDRCLNNKNINYSRYGGRGIKVCERWLESFNNFLNDMGLKPSSKHSIDRIDNDGPYSPENCRWATPKEQGSNKRSNVFISIGEFKKTATDSALAHGLSPKTVMSRKSRGWSDSASLSPITTYVTDRPIFYYRGSKVRGIDYTGHTLGFFKIIKPTKIKKHSGIAWVCLCSCGKEVIKTSSHLKKRSALHCGCKDYVRSGKTYARYWDMLAVCRNKNRPAYKYYGGKGIKVCPYWLESPINFINDMGVVPKGKKLRRKDKSLDFSKENCFWGY